LAGIFLFGKNNKTNNNIYEIKLDGNKINDLNTLYSELKNIMKLPKYFNGNFNSLDECINDLSWISMNTDFELEITNFKRFLKNEEENNKITFFEILRDIDLNHFKDNENGDKKQNFYIILERTSETIIFLKKLGIEIN
jgi:RNAse (barnase) inhibitor barstar